MAPTPPVLELDDFHFHTMDTTEDMTRYSPGGYHPIVIGDILHPSSEGSESGSRRYRITHRLAYGSYSTVWLAQKLDSSNAFVVVKVTTGDGDPTKEAAMLEAANKMQINGGHVVTLLDHFTLNGPNGTHPVLVTDIVAPILSIPKRPSFWYKAFAHGIVKAVAQLQDAGIVHGDLHLGNIRVAIPELAYQDPHEVMITLLTYDITVVLPVSATLQTPSLPPYIITPSDIGNYYNRIARSDLPQTKIYDFGSAHEAGTPPLSFQCAVETCAPEMAFARVVEKIDNPPVEPPADVWALGAAIYEIVSRSPLFDVGMTALPRSMAAMADSLPPVWQDCYSSLTDPPEVSPSGADAWWASQLEDLSRRCADQEDTDRLIRLLRKVLVPDSAKRPSAAEVLQDPWFPSPADHPSKSEPLTYNLHRSKKFICSSAQRSYP